MVDTAGGNSLPGSVQIKKIRPTGPVERKSESGISRFEITQITKTSTLTQMFFLSEIAAKMSK